MKARERKRYAAIKKSKEGSKENKYWGRGMNRGLDSTANV